MPIFPLIRNSLVEWFNQALSGKGKRGRITRLFFFGLLLLPVPITAGLDLINTYRELTRSTISQRESIAYMTSLTLKEKFDRLRDLAIALATRAEFRFLLKRTMDRSQPVKQNREPRSLFTEKDWHEARELLGDIRQNLPYVSQILIADVTGTLLADISENPHVLGKNFSSFDWFEGVIQEWKPYASEAYQWQVKPYYNVVAVACPIKVRSEVLGILVLQIRLDAFFEWAHSIRVGPSGFVYFVDQKGHAVGHPQFPPQGNIPDYSKFPVVRKVLEGKRGVDKIVDPQKNEKLLAAYHPISEYDWGVIVVQPEHLAFEARNNYLKTLLVIYSVIFILDGLMALLFLHFLRQQRKSQDERRESEQRYAELIEAAPDPIMTINTIGLVQSMNSAVTAISGYQTKDLVGKHFATLGIVASSSLPLAFKEFTKALLGIEQPPFELNVTRKDRTTIILEAHCRPIRKDDQIVSVLVVFRDVTERKKAEEALRERETIQTRAELVSVVSHELRTPLQAIKEGISVVVEGLTGDITPEQREFLELAGRNVDRLSRLINDFLDFQKLDARGITYNFAPYPINDLIEEAAETMNPLAKNKGIALHLELSQKLPSVKMDRDRIMQVLVNLINNALHFTDHGKVSILTYLKTDEGVVVQVKDTGIGIKENDLAKLFQTFGQIHTGKDRKTGGTGLGLAISKKIVEQHHGKIWVESKYGKGSTFSFILPPS